MMEEHPPCNCVDPPGWKSCGNYTEERLLANIRLRQYQSPWWKRKLESKVVSLTSWGPRAQAYYPWRRYESRAHAYIPWERYKPLFHDPCDSCDSHSSETFQRKLCLSCRHLRIRHLIICAPVWKNIPLGLLKEVSQRQNCAFCRIVFHSIQRNSHGPGSADIKEFDDATVLLKHIQNRSEGPTVQIEFSSSRKVHTSKLDCRDWPIMLRFQEMRPYSRKAKFSIYGGQKSLRWAKENLTWSRGSGFDLPDCEEEEPTWSWQNRIESADYLKEQDIEADWSNDMRLSSDESRKRLHPCKREVFINGITLGSTSKGDSLLMHLVTPKVNWVLIQAALLFCSQKHPVTCQHNQGSRRPRRLVDAISRRVVNTPSKCVYLALSYVWGNSNYQKIVALKENITNLKRAGGLPCDVVSATIEDSLRACVLLGYRYIWIDTLCIIQDDHEDKATEILAMGDIYSGAFLTIVAASGLHADAGLPGVGSILRLRQLGVRLDSLEVVEVLPSIDLTVNNSVWNTRGWTFQERLLSKKCLFFTPSQVFLRCGGGLWSEDPCRDTFCGFGRCTDYRPLDPTALSHPLRELTVRICDYNARNLSSDADTLNAFEGICNILSRQLGHETRYIFGLPQCDFDVALLWQPIGETRCRIRSDGLVLPTWSWISVQGKIKLESITPANESAMGGGLLKDHSDICSVTPTQLVDLYICVDESQGFTILQTKQKRWQEASPRKGLLTTGLDYGEIDQTSCSPTPTLSSLPSKVGRLAFRTQLA